MNSRISFPPLALLAAALIAGCGGSDAEPDVVSIEGLTIPMLVSTIREFEAEVVGLADQTVTWSVQEGVTGGTITALGRFTAGTTPGTYHIIATSNADPEEADTVAITVKGFGAAAALGMPAYGVAVNGGGTIATANNHLVVRFATVVPGDSIVVGGTPVHVAYAPDGATAYVTLQSGDSLVRVRRSPASELNRVGYGHSLYNLAVHPQGSAVYVTTATGWLFKAHPSTLAKQDSVALASASNGLAFAPNGNRLYVSTIGAGIVYAIDPGTLDKVDSFEVGSGAQRVAVAPSGDSVYVANEGVGGVNIIRPSTGTVTTLSLAGTPYGLALSADGAALYVALLNAGAVRVLGRPGLDSLATITVGGSPRNVAAAPSGEFIVVSTEENTVRIE